MLPVYFLPLLLWLFRRSVPKMMTLDFFILASEAKVHACMNLPSVANVRPMPERGRRYIKYFVTIRVLPGGTAEESVQKLYIWLDRMGEP